MNPNNIKKAAALLAEEGLDLARVLDDAYEYRRSEDDDEDGDRDNRQAALYGEAYNILI